MYSQSDSELIKIANKALEVLLFRAKNNQWLNLQLTPDLYRARIRIESIIAHFNSNHYPEVGDVVEYDEFRGTDDADCLSHRANDDFVKVGVVRKIGASGDAYEINVNHKSVYIWRRNLRILPKDYKKDLDLTTPVPDFKPHTLTTQDFGTW
jgi:hypothetical protein